VYTRNAADNASSTLEIRSPFIWYLSLGSTMAVNIFFRFRFFMSCNLSDSRAKHHIYEVRTLNIVGSVFRFILLLFRPTERSSCLPVCLLGSNDNAIIRYDNLHRIASIVRYTHIHETPVTTLTAHTCAPRTSILVDFYNI